MTIIFCSIFVVLGFMVMFKGLRGAIKRQLTVSDSSKSIWIIVLAFLPNIVWSLYTFGESFTMPE